MRAARPPKQFMTTNIPKSLHYLRKSALKKYSLVYVSLICNEETKKEKMVSFLHSYRYNERIMIRRVVFAICPRTQSAVPTWLLNYGTRAARPHKLISYSNFALVLIGTRLSSLPMLANERGRRLHNSHEQPMTCWFLEPGYWWVLTSTDTGVL